MGGQMDEARIIINSEHFQALESKRKLVLVSNHKQETIMHYVPFLARK
jgi:hypothetical protein